MIEPRRLNQSGGISQRLLSSASLDKPSEASRRHATNLAATASAFSSSSSGTTRRPQRRASPALALATWIVVGAAASVTLGFVASRFFPASPAPRAAAPLLTAPTPRGAAASSPDISPEPAVRAAPPPPTALPSADEAREIEAARAALSRGDTNSAIAQLNTYDSAHPNGQLKPEAMALRIQALSKSGKTTEARALANEFEAKYPEHPLLPQVRGGVSK
jgi:hypothetical protein